MFHRDPMNFDLPLPDGFVRRCRPPDAARLAELERRAVRDDLYPPVVNFTGGKVRKARRVGRRGQPVICRETGKWFRTVTLAAQWLNVGDSRIWQSVRFGHACRGLHWRYALPHETGDVPPERPDNPKAA